MRYRVRHLTRLRYAQEVVHAQFNLRLIPATWRGQTMSDYRLTITPRESRRQDISGPYWVVKTHLEFKEPLHALEVLSEFTMEVESRPLPGPGPLLGVLRAKALAMRDLSTLAPAPYLYDSSIAVHEEAIGIWAARFMRSDAGVVENASAVMSAIHGEFTYAPGVTTSRTPPAEAFELRKGVCQDFAHVMIIALRSQGIPAAYASGYLRTLPPPGRDRLVGADAMHAWVNVWCGEDLGWIGFDPTNNCLVTSDHIQIGMGRDYADVSPIGGVFVGNSPQAMNTSVDVAPLG